MPFLIVLILLIAGFLWYNWGRSRAQVGLSNTLDPLVGRLFRRKPCRWADTGGQSGTLAEYRCQVCGVSAYSTTGKPPVDCKRNTRGGL